MWTVLQGPGKEQKFWLLVPRIRYTVLDKLINGRLILSTDNCIIDALTQIWQSVSYKKIFDRCWRAELLLIGIWMHWLYWCSSFLASLCWWHIVASFCAMDSGKVLSHNNRLSVIPSPCFGKLKHIFAKAFQLTGNVPRTSGNVRWWSSQRWQRMSLL